MDHKVRYDVIARSIVQRQAMPDQHAIKLLYKGDGTPWWTCSAGFELAVPEDFPAKSGDSVTITISTGDGA